MSSPTRTREAVLEELARKTNDAKRLAGNPEKGKKSPNEHPFYDTRHQEINALLDELAGLPASKPVPANA